MVNPDWRAVPLSDLIITNCYRRLDKYSYYAHTFPILVSDLHPIGSGAIHKEQIPHSKEIRSARHIVPDQTSAPTDPHLGHMAGMTQ